MELENIKSLVTNCPIVEIKYEFRGEKREVFAELSWYSLTGSVKDRVAYQILKDAYLKGELKSGDKIVEVSSGNMGISLVAVANLLGNPVTIIMPRSMSDERKGLLKLYGATLVEVDDFNEAFQKCDEYKSQGYYCTQQFDNYSNVKAHYGITAENIINNLKTYNLNYFVSGVGTSGTLMGVGKRLKEIYNDIKVIALEPNKARIISGAKPLLPHKLQGLSDQILPSLFDTKNTDGVLQILDDDAIAMAIKLNRELSLGVGISSGANFLGCVLAGNNSVTIFPDDNKKYLSTDMLKDTETELVNSIKLISVREMVG